MLHTVDIKMATFELKGATTNQTFEVLGMISSLGSSLFGEYQSYNELPPQPLLCVWGTTFYNFIPCFLSLEDSLCLIWFHIFHTKCSVLDWILIIMWLLPCVFLMNSQRSHSGKSFYVLTFQLYGAVLVYFLVSFLWLGMNSDLFTCSCALISSVHCTWRFLSNHDKIRTNIWIKW